MPCQDKSHQKGKVAAKSDTKSSGYFLTHQLGGVCECEFRAGRNRFRYRRHQTLEVEKRTVVEDEGAAVEAAFK